jgi:hypothetical protein
MELDCDFSKVNREFHSQNLRKKKTHQIHTTFTLVKTEAPNSSFN